MFEKLRREIFSHLFSNSAVNHAKLRISVTGYTRNGNILSGQYTSLEIYQPHDLVLYRNTLIYFTRADQKKVLGVIVDILPTDGVLVLGKSETLVGDVRSKLLTIYPFERIYRKT